MILILFRPASRIYCSSNPIPNSQSLFHHSSIPGGVISTKVPSSHSRIYLNNHSCIHLSSDSSQLKLVGLKKGSSGFTKITTRPGTIKFTGAQNQSLKKSHRGSLRLALIMGVQKAPRGSKGHSGANFYLSLFRKFSSITLIDPVSNKKKTLPFSSFSP